MCQSTCLKIYAQRSAARHAFVFACSPSSSSSCHTRLSYCPWGPLCTTHTHCQSGLVFNWSQASLKLHFRFSRPDNCSRLPSPWLCFFCLATARGRSNTLLLLIGALARICKITATSLAREIPTQLFSSICMCWTFVTSSAPLLARPIRMKQIRARYKALWTSYRMQVETNVEVVWAKN